MALVWPGDQKPGGPASRREGGRDNPRCLASSNHGPHDCQEAQSLSAAVGLVARKTLSACNLSSNVSLHTRGDFCRAPAEFSHQGQRSGGVSNPRVSRDSRPEAVPEGCSRPKEQTENLSLPTQLRACEETAAARATRSSSASTKKARARRRRTAASFKVFSRYCRTHKGKIHFVVVSNITRFAREKYRPLRASCTPEIARHLAAVGHKPPNKQHPPES